MKLVRSDCGDGSRPKLRAKAWAAQPFRSRSIEENRSQPAETLAFGALRTATGFAFGNEPLALAAVADTTIM